MKKAWLVALVGLVLTNVALAEDDLAGVEKKIIESWYKHESMTAKMTGETQFEMPGMTMQQKSTGTVEMLRKGEKTMSRMEMKMSTTRKMGDNEMKSDDTMLSVADGEFNYVLSDTMGQKMAIKSKADPMSSGEPRAMFEQLKKDHTLKLLPEEMVGADKTYVIEATPKQSSGQPGEPTRMVMFFAQADGVMRKMVMFTGEKPMTTMTWTDVKFDAKIDPERFIFKAPEGVVVQDMTSMPTGQ